MRASVGWAAGRGLACGGQVWPSAPSPVGTPWEPEAEPTGEDAEAEGMCWGGRR